MSVSDVIYPNQPLVEVVFEIRFPGDVRIECERHLFWEKIKEDYPNILVPRPNPEQAVALMPYRFRSKDQSMTVLVSLNTFAVSTTVYPGYKEFSKEVLRLYEIFGSLYKLEKLNRVGWRYVNVIQFVRENRTIPLSNFLTLGFKVPESIPEEFINLNLVFESEHKGASVITRLETIESTTSVVGSKEALLLDFDYGKVPSDDEELVFPKVPEYLDMAHSKTRQLFEEFITEDYRQYLKGDVI
ncbi:MAG: TIGR04255 family protein [Gammaproteobacteria bacterium]|nr:TIGR04255 family protein [Gammaproteobacteria bacterium]